MTTPTPEQFLAAPYLESEEDEPLPESAAAPGEVVESEHTLPLNPGQRPVDQWTIREPVQAFKPLDLTGYVAQIAADIRSLVEMAVPNPDYPRAVAVHQSVYGSMVPEEVAQQVAEAVSRPRTVENLAVAGASETGAELDDMQERYQISIEACADAEAKAWELEQLVERIKGIVKPSKSQVSLEVKKAIEEWANPQVEEPDVDDGDHRDRRLADEIPDEFHGTTDGAPVVSVPVGNTHTQATFAGTDYCTECSAAAQDWVGWPCPTAAATTVSEEPVPPVVTNAAAPVVAPVTQPAATDHVEAWRAYARQVQPDQAWEGKNRSQIRTALGIAQPTSRKS